MEEWVCAKGGGQETEAELDGDYFDIRGRCKFNVRAKFDTVFIKPLLCFLTKVLTFFDSFFKNKLTGK